MQSLAQQVVGRYYVVDSIDEKSLHIILLSALERWELPGWRGDGGAFGMGYTLLFETDRRTKTGLAL